MTHARPFIRAWAIGEFVEMSRSRPDLAPEAESLIDTIYATETASVKARIRQVLASPRA